MWGGLVPSFLPKSCPHHLPLGSDPGPGMAGMGGGQAAEFARPGQSVCLAQGPLWAIPLREPVNQEAGLC